MEVWGKNLIHERPRRIYRRADKMQKLVLLFFEVCFNHFYIEYLCYR